MAHATVEAVLAQRKTEILGLLGPYAPLVEELAQIDKLLSLYQAPGHAMNGLAAGLAVAAPAGRVPGTGAFVPNPNSKSSRVLAAAKTMLEADPSRDLPYLTILKRLPEELVGKSRHAREHIRGILQKGERVGIEYVNAQHVRLKR